MMGSQLQSVTSNQPAPEDYRRLIESFAQALWETDATGIVVEDSPSWRAYTGQTLQQWLGEGWVSAIHPDDRSAALSQWQQAVAAQTPINAEFRLQSPDGGWRWTNVRATAILGPDGSICKWIGLNIDITEKKQIEEALGQSEERFRAFVTATSDAVYRMSADWREMHQLVGKSFLLDTSSTSPSWLEQYIPPQDQDQVQTIINGAIAAGGPFELAHRVIQADGSLGWTFSRAIPILNQQGEIVEWFGTASDITARKRTEEALRHQQETYRDELEQQVAQRTAELVEQAHFIQTITELIPDVVMVLEYPSRNIIYSNRDALIALGFEAGEIIKMSFDERVNLAHPDDVADMNIFYDQFLSLADNQEAQLEYRLKNKKGDWLMLSLRGNVFQRDAEGRATRLLLIAQDITERKKNEQQVLQLKEELAQQAAHKQAEERQAFLLRLSDALRPLADPAAIQVTVARLLGEQLGANQVHYGETIGDDLVIHQGYSNGLPPMVGRFRSVAFGEKLTATHRVGRIQVVENIEADPLNTEAERKILRAAHVGAYITVPLLKKDQWIATLAVQCVHPRVWTSQDVELVREVAERTWAAVERTHAEKALQESEKRLRLALEATEMGMWEWNLKTNEVYWNEQHFRLFGMKPQLQPISPDAFISHIHPDARERVTTLLQAAIDQRSLYNTEFCAVLDDGSMRWMSGYGRVAEEVDGQPVRMSGVIFDVNERRRSEQALQQSEERLKKALSISTVGILFFDADSTFTGANNAFLTLSGFSRQAVERRQITTKDMTLPQWMPRSRQAMDELKAVGRSTPYEKELRRPDGTHWWGLFAGTRLSEEEFVEFVLDVTERRRAEEALYQSETRQRAILESAKDYAIFTTDLNRRVDSWNRGAQALFGYSEEQIMHQSADRLFTPEDQQQGVPQHEAQKAASEGAAENERWHLHQNGSRFYGSGVTTPLRNEAGSIVGLLKVMRNLTTQKRAEENLREADQRKDEFLAMLAHELRNPMATIRNGLNILRLTNETDPVTGQTVGMMNRQVDHLVRLVDDLLDVSRISQGKIELQRERLELGALVAGAVEAMRPQYAALGKGLYFTPAPLPLFVDGDSTRLSQVVTNLLTNGLRYTGQQGQVRVSVVRGDGDALLRVADNGIGLRADQLTAVFELFVQADNSLARQQGGLGIGLTLVQRLVSMHGGRVEARSPGLGGGSEFLVTLPLLDEPANEPMTMVIPSDSELSRHRILVIDDNADAALTLSMLLKLKGYAVHTQYSGRAGIEVAETLRPTVILCDIGMPEMDGYETVRLIRQQAWGKDVLLMALSGYGQAEDSQRAKEAGFDGHLVKPVDLSALVALIRVK